jgi:hypothetical protein
VHELTDLTTGHIYAGKIIPKSRITKPHHKEKVTKPKPSSSPHCATFLVTQSIPSKKRKQHAKNNKIKKKATLCTGISRERLRERENY